MIWRAMTVWDIAAVKNLADIIHSAYPEETDVFSERLALFPKGCLVLETGEQVAGYIVSHPWKDGKPPALNTLLGQLPQGADVYYLHDIAIAFSARGQYAAQDGLAIVCQTAATHGFDRLVLTAVGGTVPFWEKHGFAASRALARETASYGNDACLMERRIT